MFETRRSNAGLALYSKPVVLVETLAKVFVLRSWLNTSSRFMSRTGDLKRKEVGREGYMWKRYLFSKFQ